MKEIRVYTFEINDAIVAVSNRRLAMTPITPDRLKELHPEVEEHTIKVRTPYTYGMSLELERAVTSVNSDGSMTRDASKVNGKLIEIAVESWTFTVPVSADGLSMLPVSVAQCIVEEVNTVCYPNLLDDDHFFEALKNKRDQ